MGETETQILTKITGQLQGWSSEFLPVLFEGFITFKRLNLLVVSNDTFFKGTCTLYNLQLVSRLKSDWTNNLKNADEKDFLKCMYIEILSSSQDNIYQ